MIRTPEFDIRALLDQLEEPLIPVVEVIADADAADDFDGVCTQHEGCRSIL